MGYYKDTSRDLVSPICGNLKKKLRIPNTESIAFLCHHTNFSKEGKLTFFVCGHYSNQMSKWTTHEEKVYLTSQSVSQWMTNKGVCRTALATPGLSNTVPGPTTLRSLTDPV